MDVDKYVFDSSRKLLKSWLNTLIQHFSYTVYRTRISICESRDCTPLQARNTKALKIKGYHPNPVAGFLSGDFQTHGICWGAFSEILCESLISHLSERSLLSGWLAILSLCAFLNSEIGRTSNYFTLSFSQPWITAINYFITFLNKKTIFFYIMARFHKPQLTKRRMIVLLVRNRKKYFKIQCFYTDILD